MSTTTETKNISADIQVGFLGDSLLRKEAAAIFSQQLLPTSKQEEYRHTPLTKALEKNFDFAVKQNPTSPLSTIDTYRIPELDAHVVVMLNGEYMESLSSIDNSNIKIELLDEVTHADHLAKYADYKTDAYVAWNTAAWKNGICISIAPNAVIEKPIIIHRIHDTTNGEVKSITRNLIQVGKSGEITIIEKFDSIGSNPNFSNVVTEAVVHENAGLNFYSIQADHGNRYQFGQTTIWQNNHSRVSCYTFTLDGKFVRNNLQLLIDGEGCDTHMYGLYLLHGDTFADNHTVADHRKPNSNSNELYKGVLEGNARGIFNGKIFVRPNAQKTNAFQSNRNILLSDTAIINTKPQLEIWADDVKCSHGCTTGQLDEEALFYLQSRGINKDVARAMMLYAFAGEVLETIKNDTLKQYMDALISERLHKNF
jgi:Fe-S cluster assembly protein SufD